VILDGLAGAIPSSQAIILFFGLRYHANKEKGNPITLNPTFIP